MGNGIERRRRIGQSLAWSRHLGKNLVIAGALLAAGFLAAWFRFRPYLEAGTALTDGESAYSLAADEGLRHAIWEAPESYGAELAAPGGEGRGTHSPDGRYLIFEAGDSGVSRDLWIAERGADGYREPRLLAELNSAYDEAAPAFGPQGLVFASARPSADPDGGLGGLDLWVASYADGRFGTPKPLGGVNTAADETDPAPFDGGLLFASTRSRRGDHDLFELRLDPLTGESAVERLDELCDLSDEREPAVARDGRTLLFSTNRTDGLGGYDLWRSFRQGMGWTAPRALDAVNTGLDERAPTLEEHGFALLFLRSENGGVGAPLRFHRAQSRELFRTPGDPVGWSEVLTLLMLLLLALLAWGAKHWRGLDVLYRCLLVSVLAHLLLGWWLRGVYPERAEIELPEGEARVALAWRVDASATEGRRAERGGQLELARATESSDLPARAESLMSPSQRSEARATPSSASAAQVSEREPLSTPQAQPEFSERSSSVATATSTPLDSLESLPAPDVAPAASMALGDRAPVQAERNESSAPSGGPQRASSSATSRSAPSSGPSLASAAKPSAEAQRQAAQPRAEVSFDTAAPTSQGVRQLALSGLAAPAARAIEGPTEVAVGMRSVEVSRSEQASGGPQREALEAASEGASVERSTPSRPASLEGLVARRDRGTERPGRANLSVERSFAGSAPVAALQPLAAPEPSLASASTAGGAPRELGLGEVITVSSERTSRLSAGPSRAPSERTGAELGGAVSPGSASSAAPDRASGQQALPSAEWTASTGGVPSARREVRVAAAPAGGPWDREPAVALEPSSALGIGGALALGDATASPERASRESGGPRRFERRRDDGPRRAPSAASAVAPSPERGGLDTPEVATSFTDKRFSARSGQARVEALERFGGNAATERAVADGLAYLASVQTNLGYWGDPDDKHSKYGHVVVGKTGLCALAFLGAGHLPGDGGPYSDTLNRALEFLMGVQGERTGHFGDTTSYSHGIATYALGEAAALLAADDPRAGRYREAVERAAEWILSQQSNDADERRFGGWSYYYPDGRVFRSNGRADTWPRTSITAWQVMALESAKLSGVEVPEPAISAARNFLLRAWDRDLGDYRYSHDPSRLRSSWPTLPASTPAALFALSILGEDLTERRFRAARSAVVANAPRAYRWRGDDAFVERAEGNLYHWYYGSLAMLRAGGDDWQRWNAALQEALLPSQNDDGSWPLLGGYADDYAGDDRRDLSYTTAMCVLCLEVYYRYLTPVVEGPR